MVDVGDKPPVKRTAIAEAVIQCMPSTVRAVQSGSTKKGDVLATVRLAAIQASKRTAELIPLCHPLALSKVEVDVALKKRTVHILVTCTTTGPTGVEMEALTAASIGALTFYDMVKAVDRSATFEVALIEKAGGKSGTYRRARAT